MPNSPYALTRRTALKKGALLTGSLLIGTAGATGTAAAGIGEGRVAHYPLNNLKGKGKTKDEVHDASPEGNDGVAMGDVSVAKGDGRVGNAFEFDGDGDYVRVPHDDSFNVEAVTAATWVKFTDAARFHFFLSKRGAGDDEYQMYYRGQAHGASNTLAYWDGETIYDKRVNLDSGTWHHLAWVVDEDGFRGYHDGDEVVEMTGAKTPDGAGSSPLYIGYDTKGNYAQGMVDEVRLYDRALSESEIEELASMGD